MSYLSFPRLAHITDYAISNVAEQHRLPKFILLQKYRNIMRMECQYNLDVA